MTQDSDRLYSEKETGQLIKRSTELKEASTSTSEHGLSAGEITKIAAEIGIEPQHLKTAMLELDGLSSTVSGQKFWGGPFSVNLHRLSNARISDAQWEQMGDEIRSFTGSDGKVTSFGTAVEWSRTIPDLERLQVTVSRGDERTAIRIRERYKSGAAWAYFFTLLVSLGGTIGAAIGLDVSLLAGGILAGGVTTGMLATLRSTLVSLTKKQNKKLSRLMERLSAIIKEGDVHE